MSGHQHDGEPCPICGHTESALDAALGDPSMELAQLVLHLARDIETAGREIAKLAGDPDVVLVGVNALLAGARRRAIDAGGQDRERAVDHLITLHAAVERAGR